MTDLIWKNITASLGELKPWAENPRMSTKKQARKLLESWETFGQVETIAVGPGLEVYDGHQRLSALLTVYGKDYKIDARQSNRPLTDDERRKLVITLHAGAVGSWNWDSLSNWNGAQLVESGFDADLLKGWKADIAGLKELIDSEKPPVVDVEPEIDKAEELRAKWGVESGQLWQLGEHRIICGDCTDRAVVERVMGGERAAIAFTSPPYNVGSSSSLTGNTHIINNFYQEKYNDDKSQSSYLELLKNFTLCIMEYCDYAFINLQILSGNKLAFIDYLNLFKDKFADIAIWNKGHAQPAMAQRVMDSYFEFIIILSHTSTRAIGTKEFRGMVPNIYSGKPQRNNEYAEIHAATFPIDFPAHFIETFTNERESIIEPFSGSGTTLIACEQLNRKCRAVEISPAYVAVAIERWVTLTGGTPVILE